MIRTVTVTELRAELSNYLERLAESPVLVLTHGKPAAVLLEPANYESLLDRIELLEDLLDGRRIVAEYAHDPSVAIDAEEVFERLGHS